MKSHCIRLGGQGNSNVLLCLSGKAYWVLKTEPINSYDDTDRKQPSRSQEQAPSGILFSDLNVRNSEKTHVCWSHPVCPAPLEQLIQAVTHKACFCRSSQRSFKVLSAFHSFCVFTYQSQRNSLCIGQPFLGHPSNHAAVRNVATRNQARQVGPLCGLGPT